MIITGLSLVVLWGLLSSQKDLNSNLHTILESPDPLNDNVPPSQTARPDLLVPTRTPTAVSTTPKTASDVIVPSLTPTRRSTRTATLTATPSPNALTATALHSSPTSKAENTATPTVTATPTTTVVVDMPADHFRIPKSDIYRLGVSLPYGTNKAYGLETLGVGWVMDWNTRLKPTIPAGIEYVQTVIIRNGILVPDVSTLAEVAALQQGSTWLIGNEPDVLWQDNAEPEVYARLYYEAYYAIKKGDPNAIVAAGGIAQPSALRFSYLDRVLTAYQSLYGASMPVQAWHIHNYLLREERGGWGIDIPPGLSENTGVLYSVEDSGNITAFKSQIYAFRQWMADRGYRGLPLIVSEYGIPMPPDYGYGLDRVSGFFKEAWYFFYTATDQNLGNPADGGRLVQRWCWFSLGVESYPAGNLLNPPAGDWTPLADVWRSLVEP